MESRTPAGRTPARTPALGPAVAAACGAGLAFHLRFLPLGPILALGVLGLSLGGRGRLLAFLAAGLLSAAVQEALPERQAPAIDSRRPVEAVVRSTGPWRPGPFGWAAPAAVERLRQGRVVSRFPRRVWIQIGDPETPPPAAERLRLKGYLRASSGFANRPPRPPGPVRLAVKTRRHLEEVGTPGPAARLSGVLRNRAEAAFAAGAAESSGAGLPLARALVLGDPSRVPQPLRRCLRRWGLAHLLAVSGLHVGLVAALALGVGLLLPRWPRLLLAAAGVGLYLLLVGPRPSLLRASAMALLALAALLLERPPSAANALAVFVLAAVLAEPALVGDLGFQLSVAATGGIVLLAPRLAQRWQAGALGRRLPGLVRPLAVSVSAQLAVMPWALPAFCLLPLAAPVANLAAVPWTGLLLAASLGWTALAGLWPAAARAAVPLLDALAWPFEALAAVPPLGWESVPAALPGPAPGLVAAGLAGLGLAVCFFPRRGSALAAVLLLLGMCRGAGAEAPGLTVLDVGQGDAILLRDAGGAILVDGGGFRVGDLGGRVLVPALAGLGVRRLDAVVVTHPDHDHCGGLVDLADYLPVGEVWMAEMWRESPCARALLDRRGLTWRPLAAGEQRELGRWRLEVLHPGENFPGGDNDRSLVLRASVETARGPRRFLLTGDVQAAAERQLLETASGTLAADVLKVAHHGSKSSSTAAFLRAAAPRWAVVSAGRGNPYGHPAAAVVGRLERHGARVLRTDDHGLVEFTVRPSGALAVAVESFPGRRSAGRRPP